MLLKFWSCLVPTILFGMDPPPVDWVTGFNNGICESHPHAGVQTSDGGFFMVGDSVCWADKHPTASRYQFVVKADKQGKKQWSVQLGDTGYNYGKFGIQLSDGNLLLVGSKSVTNHQFKCGYSENRYLAVLSVTNGSILSETIFRNVFGDNRRDGFMCINPVNNATDNEYIATGWIGGEPDDTQCNDDEPMFLIFGGFSFLMKLKYNPLTYKFDTVFEKVFNSSNILNTMVPMQGMRVFHDINNKQYGISTATHANYSDYNVQFGMVTTDYNGNIEWSKMFPIGAGSHPYALTLSSQNDGYVIAGLQFINGGLPNGRMCKVSTNGNKLWDKNFRYDGKGMNTECYGIWITKDNGYIVTCGTGIEPPIGALGVDKVNDQDTWLAMLHRTDKDGNQQWQKAYTNKTGNENNAGEYVITLNNGEYAMLIDSNSFGPDQGQNGGNFGLMVLQSDD
eukprot:527954_1